MTKIAEVRCLRNTYDNGVTEWAFVTYDSGRTFTHLMNSIPGTVREWLKDKQCIKLYNTHLRKEEFIFQDDFGICQWARFLERDVLTESNKWELISVDGWKEINRRRYYTTDREAGNRIECFDTKEEAMKAIERYEKDDRDEGIYVENFYDVEEEGDE